ncbi:MAG TPA: hypothetical protein VN915_04185 [Elusimicrobiota bacterium]|nr:hypothetical protein [Elusimicrobiota bacterium]
MCPICAAAMLIAGVASAGLATFAGRRARRRSGRRTSSWRSSWGS